MALRTYDVIKYFGSENCDNRDNEATILNFAVKNLNMIIAPDAKGQFRLFSYATKNPVALPPPHIKGYCYIFVFVFKCTVQCHL